MVNKVYGTIILPHWLLSFPGAAVFSEMVVRFVSFSLPRILVHIWYRIFEQDSDICAILFQIPYLGQQDKIMVMGTLKIVITLRHPLHTRHSISPVQLISEASR